MDQPAVNERVSEEVRAGGVLVSELLIQRVKGVKEDNASVILPVTIEVVHVRSQSSIHWKTECQLVRGNCSWMPQWDAHVLSLKKIVSFGPKIEGHGTILEAVVI